MTAPIARAARWLAVALVAVSVAGTATVGAQDAPVAPSGPTPIEVRELGLPDTITLTGLVAKRTVFVPVGDGLRPTSIRGTARVGADTPSARVDVWSEGRQLAVLQLVGGAAPVPFELDVSALTAGRTDPLPVEISTMLPFSDQFCRGQLTIPSVVLDDLRTVVLPGARPALEVADFLPAVLRHARIWVPAKGDEGTTGAALRLATGLVHRYAATGPLAIQVLPLPRGGAVPDVPYEALARDFAIGAATQRIDAIEVVASPRGAAVLLLPATAPDVAAAALFDGLAEGAVVPAVGVDGTPVGPIVPAREQRLVDLGAPNAALTGTGRVAFDLFVPQSTFGGMTEDWTLRVSGRHTPEDDVTVSVLVNGTLLESVATGDDGTFAIRAVVEEPLLARDNTIEVVAEERSDDGPCSAAAHPIDLQISNDATITVELGRSLPFGFLRLPQGLLPEVDAVVSDHGAATVGAIVGMATEVQRLSPIEIGTVVRGVTDLAGSGRPALVAWAGDVADLDLPLSITPGATPPLVDLDDRALELQAGIPVLQVIEQDGTPSLVASAGAPEDLASLVALVADRTDGFRSLTGDAAVVSHGELHLVRTVAPGPGPEPSGDREVEDLGWLWAAGSVAVVLLGLGVLVVRRRRRHRSGAPPS